MRINSSVKNSFSVSARTFSLVILSSFSLLFSVSCRTPEASSGLLLTDLAAHMIRNVGGEISSVMMVEPVRAQEGLAIRIAGREVAFYKYDLNLLRAKKKYDTIKARKELYISGVRFEAEVNGPFVMIDHKKNMKRDEIVQAFHSFH